MAAPYSINVNLMFPNLPPTRSFVLFSSALGLLSNLLAQVWVYKDHIYIVFYIDTSQLAFVVL